MCFTQFVEQGYELVEQWIFLCSIVQYDLTYEMDYTIQAKLNICEQTKLLHIPSGPSAFLSTTED